MVKRILGFLLVLLTVVFVASASFAVIKGLEKMTPPTPPINVDSQQIVKVGEEVVIPEGMEVRSVVAVGGPVTIYGNVKEDVVSIGGSVYLKEAAAVGGDVVSVGGKIDKEPRALIGGNQVEVSIPGVNPAVGYMTKGGILKSLVIFGLLAFVGFLVLAVIIVALFTPQLGRASAIVEGNLWKNFLIGLLIAILFVPVIILLAVSVVGIVLIPFWIALLVAAGLFGYIAVGHLLGKRVLYLCRIYGQSMMVEMLTGLILLALVGLVPFLGAMVKCLAMLCGLGGVYWTKFGTK